MNDSILMLMILMQLAPTLEPAHPQHIPHSFAAMVEIYLPRCPRWPFSYLDEESRPIHMSPAVRIKRHLQGSMLKKLRNGQKLQ